MESHTVSPTDCKRRVSCPACSWQLSDGHEGGWPGKKAVHEEEGAKTKTEKETHCLHQAVPNSDLLVMLVNKIAYCLVNWSQFLLLEAQRMPSIRKSASSQVCLERDYHIRAE